MAETTYTCDAYDDDGAVTTSNAVVVQRLAPPPQNQPPSATLTASFRVAPNGTPTTLICSAADPDGVITRYEFKRGATVVQDGQNNQYSETPPDNARTSYTCTVYDNNATPAFTVSNVVTVTRPVPDVQRLARIGLDNLFAPDAPPEAAAFAGSPFTSSLPRIGQDNLFIGE